MRKSSSSVYAGTWLLKIDYGPMLIYLSWGSVPNVVTRRIILPHCNCNVLHLGSALWFLGQRLSTVQQFLLPRKRETAPVAGITLHNKLNSSLFHWSNLLQQKAIIANGLKALPTQLDLPCHVPLTSNSAMIPALKYIMKDIQNISKWHQYWFINARECCPNWI